MDISPLLKVTNAEIVNSIGLVIYFDSLENIVSGQYVSIEFNSKKKFFQAIDIKIVGGVYLQVRAKEASYNKLIKQSDLDIRAIVGLDVEIIRDFETISNIRNQETWC